MVKGRGRPNSLDALMDTITAGSPALALQRLPSRRQPVASSVAAIAVLDIQQVSITRPGVRTVAVLISDGDAPLLTLGLVGDHLGIQACEPLTGIFPGAAGFPSAAGFTEQVIELVESDVYRKGQRKWLACPGLDGRPCNSRRMKLYLPPGAAVFACTDCHGIIVPHTPDRPLRWHNQAMRQHVLRWHEPVELTRRSA